jgi:hypothetical protein
MSQKSQPQNMTLKSRTHRHTTKTALLTESKLNAMDPLDSSSDYKLDNSLMQMCQRQSVLTLKNVT